MVGLVGRAAIGRTFAAISFVLPVAACGAGEPPTSGEIFGEYVRSTEVIGDEFASENTPDRMANFASFGSPDAVLGMIMTPRPCGESGCSRPWGRGGASSPDGTGLDAAHAFSGPGGEVYERKALVKHENGDLELLSLYVARRSDGTSALVDSAGERHTGGLDGFRENNDVLDSGDHMLVPRDITAISGKGELVVVTGHTPSKWTPWFIGGGVVLVGAVVAGVLVRRVLLARDGLA
ncbi:hypothetical protein [Actinomadura algeriensis]|uniref:Lipoprotein n=1 Tax=Actinomadura algeriensis TaxID=1679523 RepID=A0ABR9JJS3_9ACTN|nr:hypothetical protein [Actinomadura algeriensis]MBE1530802.1 hypothetical protein [Actinomadura algeriensis]